MSSRQYPGVVVPASLAATFLFNSGWFTTITAKHAPLAIALAYDVFVKLPTIVLALWLALRMARDRGAHHSVPAWVPTAFVAATVVPVPWFRDRPLANDMVRDNDRGTVVT